MTEEREQQRRVEHETKNPCPFGGTEQAVKQNDFCKEALGNTCVSQWCGGNGNFQRRWHTFVLQHLVGDARY